MSKNNFNGFVYTQLKNMINTLYLFYNGGDKNSMKTTFWLENYHKFKCNWVSKGIAGIVPKLWETHIIWYPLKFFTTLVTLGYVPQLVWLVMWMCVLYPVFIVSYVHH